MCKVLLHTVPLCMVFIHAKNYILKKASLSTDVCMYVIMCVCVCVCDCVCVLLSHVRLFATPWTVACQAPLSTEFSRQEYWSGLTFPSP